MLDQEGLQAGLNQVAVLAKTNRISELEEVVTELRSRFGNNAGAFRALAFVLNANDRFAEAFSVATEGLTVDPAHPLLHHNAARALSIRGRTAASRAYSMEAARLLPDNPFMQFHFAGVQLALGEYREGWKRYKSFYDLPHTANQRLYPAFPEWKGEPVSGSRFLLVGEQGRGDEIQFLRMADWLDRQGATVDVLVSESVACLAASMPSIRAVFTAIPSGSYTFWCHMLRMPDHIGLDLPMLPVSMPYLSAAPEIQNHWKTQIDTTMRDRGTAKNRQIGFAWAGNPTHALDRFRSIRIDALRPLFGLTGISWFSVQKGDREHESEALSHEFDIQTLGPAINAFTDTLGILHALDLLITVDTSVAHLAGAAGLPVWTLVAANTEWRWLANRSDSPWYPSMRIFRQPQLGDWESVIEDVRCALQDWLGA
jgi:tetratricopeptide (TPR) repeat protein